MFFRSIYNLFASTITLLAQHLLITELFHKKSHVWGLQCVVFCGIDFFISIQMFHNNFFLDSLIY